MKTLTIWTEDKSIGAQFKDGEKNIYWKDLSRQERFDFVNALKISGDFFLLHIMDE